MKIILYYGFFIKFFIVLPHLAPTDHLDWSSAQLQLISWGHQWHYNHWPVHPQTHPPDLPCKTFKWSITNQKALRLRFIADSLAISVLRLAYEYSTETSYGWARPHLIFSSKLNNMMIWDGQLGPSVAKMRLASLCLFVGWDNKLSKRVTKNVGSQQILELK